MTKRQHDFCIAYVATRNPKTASIVAGYTETYSRTKSYTLLKKPEIIEEIATLSEKYYKTQFEELALTAIKELNSVITDSENRSSQLRGIMYILETSGITPERVTVSKPNIVFALQIPDEMKEFMPDD